MTNAYCSSMILELTYIIEEFFHIFDSKCKKQFQKKILKLLFTKICL